MALPSAAATTSQKFTAHRIAWSWSQLLYFFGALVAGLLLMLAIQYGNGYYNHFSLRLLLLSVGLWIGLIPALFLIHPAGQRSGRLLSFPTRSVILFVAVLFLLELGLSLQDAFIYYNQIPLFPHFARGAIWLALLVGLSYLLEPLAGYGWLRAGLVRYRFLLAMLLSVILKFVTVFASYINLVDVGIMMQESSANLLAGLNPYNTPTAGFGGFTYPPLYLLMPLPAYIIFGDTRFGSVLWELVGVLLMVRLAKTELAAGELSKLAELIILLFAWQPRGLFVIEQGWGEPVAVGLIGISLYLLHRRPRGPAADILLGALGAVKQYFVFMWLPVFILYGFSWKRYLITALSFGLVMLPFLLWDPVALYNHIVVHYLNLPIATDSLGLTAYFWEQGILIPRWISPVLAGGVGLGLSWLLRPFGPLGYLHTAVLTLFCLFIFGQQAFANYYYLLSFLQLMGALLLMVDLFGGSANRIALSAGHES